jgi:hypothetical protein
VCEHAFESLLREASALQGAHCSEVAAERSSLAKRALTFWLEGSERRLGRVGSDALRLEIGADPLVAVASVCEVRRTIARETRVVEVAGPKERLDGLLLCGRRDAGALELCPQRGRGVIAPGESPHRPAERSLALLARRAHLGLDRLLRHLGRLCFLRFDPGGGGRSLLLGGDLLVVRLRDRQ